ncbi:hypothetical protein FQN60_009693 [Etheostoma spectabile]|uniref:Heterochromatin protein 1-binding protein 3 n=1 Tax=Etheostoma spectabile TaxID=54343 RepID=A0A5J5DJM4_9PERO|nr:hypothetical protein FQN60_009693 [Etheostoma spectabile]
MPIRRAAATPTPEKAPSAAAEKEPEASSEESPSADEEPAASSATAAEGEEGEAPGEATGEAPGDSEPTENGEKADDAAVEKDGEGTGKKELKDGYKYERAKVKKVKRTIPAWASVAASKKLPVTNFAGTQNKVDNILIEAITSCNDKSGVSYQSVMKYILKKYPGMELDKKKFLIKKAMKKHLEKGTIKQENTVAHTSNPYVNDDVSAVFLSYATGVCLVVIVMPDVLKTALVKAVEKGHLKQITGKGATGTFQLRRTGNKVLLKGNTLEDAITAAITAMNEPKTCSTTTLRKHLLDANKDIKEYQLVANLRRTLTKCKVLGWMEQITGHGFTGTYQLSFPFYPSPTILYPDKFNKPPQKPPSRRRTVESSDEEESEEEESEDEAPSGKRKAVKRPPPKARRPPPAKKSRSPSQSKAKGRGRVLAKKSPAKKAVSSAKRRGRKPTASKKEDTPPPKATPVKRGAPARKPKTPAVKKLTKRGSKRPVSRESTPEEAVVPKETPRSGSKRSKPAESSPEEPKVKKPATKSGSRRPTPAESSPEEPVVKRGARSSKQSPRKSKRGKY